METLTKSQPAILGGNPVRKEFLDFSRPRITDDEKKAVLEVLDSGWLTTGVKSSTFEREFAEFVGTKYALSVNSCTAGLFLILKVLGIKQGDEVITSPNTFPATANVIEHLGARPVFCDINPGDGNINPELIAQKITPRTKGIVAVHYAGASCDMSAIKAISDHYGFFVVGDCAHAVETTWCGKNVGSISKASAYSFYATKNLTTGEGGMVVTDDGKLHREMKILRLHGLSDDAESRYSKDGNFGYDLINAGFKFNMPDILAALGIEQLRKIEDNLAKRIKLDSYYRDKLKKVDNITTLQVDRSNTHAHHLFPVLVDFSKLKCDKVEFMAAMKAENIGVSQHFKPLHLYSYYRNKYGYNKGDYPNAEKFGDMVVSLPFNQYLNESDLDDVVSALKKTIDYYSD